MDRKLTSLLKHWFTPQKTKTENSSKNTNSFKTAKDESFDWEIIKKDFKPRGGQGRIHLVCNKKTKEEAILKTLTNASSQAKDRLLREVYSLKTCNHPNIPKILDSSLETSNPFNKPFIVMEHIQGRTLCDFMNQEGFKNIALEDALEFTKVYLKTLSHAHQKGISHRDGKPRNVIIRGDKFDDPVLVDFGMSKHDLAVIRATRVNEQIGNRFLALPELLDSRVEDTSFRPESDITHSFALLLYILTNILPVQLRDEFSKAPHEREHVQLTLKERFDESTLRNLDKLFFKAFRYQPSDRYNTTEEAILAIENYGRNISDLEGREYLNSRKKEESRKRKKDLKAKYQKAFKFCRGVAFALQNALEGDYTIVTYLNSSDSSSMLINFEMSNTLTDTLLHKTAPTVLISTEEDYIIGEGNRFFKNHRSMIHESRPILFKITQETIITNEANTQDSEPLFNWLVDNIKEFEKSFDTEYGRTEIARIEMS